jgi:hypothetical protein
MAPVKTEMIEDRKRDGEIGEPAHLPEELLCVAQPVQVEDVVADDVFAPAALLDPRMPQPVGQAGC